MLVMSAPPVYGIVVGEEPPKLHRLSAMSGRTQCGKQIVELPYRPEDFELCSRCTLMDDTKR